MNVTAPELENRRTAGTPRIPVFLMINSLETGGTERQFLTLSRAFDSSEFSVEQGCLKREGPLLGEVNGIAEFTPGGNLFGWHSQRARFALGRHLRRNYTAVAHAFDFYTNLMLLPAARLAGVPVVIGSQRQIGDLLSPAKGLSQIAAFRFCDRVVCNSQAAAEQLVERGLSKRRVVVIRNGLRLQDFAEARPSLPREAGTLRVGMIARMNTQSKNHALFLRAAARIAARFPKAQFVLAGDGPLRTELEKLAQKLGLGEQIIFLGDRRDIPGVLASLDISVLPSDSESLSNAIMESMASGVAVVASDVGGNPELIRGGRGLLVPAGSESGFAKAMGDLLQEEGLRLRLAENAKRFAEENFGIDNLRARHTDLYSDLLAEKNWRPDAKSYSMPSSLPPKKMRVAIVAASLRYVGGQSVQADLLVRNWQDDPAIEAHLIAIDPPLLPSLKWAERIPGLRTVVRQPFYVRNLWRGIEGADIVHIFSASYWSFLIAPVPAWLVARLRRKKVLIHYHSGEAKDHLQRFRSARPVLARVDKLIVPSGYLASVFREFKLDAEVVPNVVDLAQFQFRVRNPLRPHLICTRGFHPYYSVDVVVRAFAEIQQKYPEARLDLVGKGPLEDQLRQLVSELRLRDVHFTGVAAHDAIASYYDEADIFINASWLDNMPVSILEAFAAGTPVVSTGPEGIRYVVEDGRTGLLSETGDAHRLAQNVIRLLEDRELGCRLALAAHEQAKYYKWSLVREQWLQVYGSLHQSADETVPVSAVSA
ncbi:MAG: glycosyltransferase [Candidatus Sulfotelmatobacter sp.]